MNEEINPLMNAWFPMKDVNDVRALGKTLEELGELTSAVARCLIQGIDEVEPVSHKPNRLWLMQEMADVQAQFGILILQFGLDQKYMGERTARKLHQMHQWRTILKENA